MKKTIKEELEEQYLRAVLLNDENLLIYTENEETKDKVDVKVRYIEYDTIVERYITSITKKEFLTKRNDLLEINDEHTAIAIFKEENKELVLNRIYMLDTHYYNIEDFLDLEYKRYFPKNNITAQLVKKRG